MARGNKPKIIVIETSPDGRKPWSISFWGKNFFFQKKEATQELKTHYANYQAEQDKPGFLNTLPRFRVSTYSRKEKQK